MNKAYVLVTILFFGSLCSYGQSIQDLIDEVSLPELTQKINEFSGEIPTTVNGNSVTIINRQQANNDLAADYLVEQFQAMDNLTITDQAFNSNGRNIIATQVGKTNPNNIYIICAHYDTVADYCADDNATGTIAVLEVARILSQQCMDNTIVYALWDEEEIGLLGSNFYANQAVANGDNILGVLNMDMMGYDSDSPGQPGDNQFDIDYRNIAGSVAMKDDIISVLNSYTFDLSVVEVNPGTTASDHSSFWFAGNFPNDAISAVLVGESWETNDETPFYHTSGDRASTLDFQYYHEMVKLITAYTATKGGLLDVDNTVSQNMTMLTSNEDLASSYQWYDCDTDMAITGATSQSFVPSSNGNYAVEITMGSCTERSECLLFEALNVASFEDGEVIVYPNPVKNHLQIESGNISDLEMKLYDMSGKLVRSIQSASGTLTTIDVKRLPQGVYFLSVLNSEKGGTFKIIKE
ncbi:MAG: M28 family peptidase [Algicola sp.]|nr:M28 family peptidase [Algicola sp.]